MSNIKRFTKRGLSVFLALVMCLSLLPTAAFAAGDTNNSTLTKSAFENAYNLGQSDTCYGIVKLDGGSITDSGTPNVWPTGNWEGAVDVTGYNWVHITSTNPDVATASWTNEGGKLNITFTPGKASGTTRISVGVDAKYPHYSLGTWNMELNFDYTVTNGSSSATGTQMGTVTRSVTYDLTTGKAVWGKTPYDGQYGERTSIGVGIINDVALRDYYYTYYYSFYAQEMLDIAVGSYDTSIATVEAYEINNTADGDDVGNTTMKGVGIKVTGLKAGTTTVVVTPKFKIPTTSNGQSAYLITRTMPITVYIKVTGDVAKNEYTLTYDANGGSLGTDSDNKAITTQTVTHKTTADSSDFTIVGTEPTYAGYTFKGWADARNATTAQYSADQTLTLFKANPTKTIYAVWEKVPTIDNSKVKVSKTPSEEYPVVGEEFTYTIKVENTNATALTGVTITDVLNEKLTFVAAGDSGTYNEGNRTVTWNNVTVPANGSKDVKVWVKANAAGEISNEAKAEWDDGSTSGNTTVTAKDPEPTARTFKVIYYNESGANWMTVEKSAEAGFLNMPEWQQDESVTENPHNMTLSDKKPTRDGYTFQHWQWGGDTNVTFDPGDTITLTANPETLTEVAADLYAVWKKNPTQYTYTLTYDANADEDNSKVSNVPGKATQGPTTATSHEFTVSTTEPTREGYTFQGWADTKNGDVKYKTGESGKETIAVNSAAPEKTVYAVWAPRTDCTYTVEWYVVGENQHFKTATRNGTFGTKVSVANEDKTVEGYTFDANNGLNKLEDTLAVSGTVLKLYFTKNPVVPPVNPNGIELVKKVNDKDSEDLTADNRNSELTYTITVTNNTNVALEDLLIRDKMPEGLALVENSGTVKGGNSEAQTVTVDTTNGYCDWKINGTVADKDVVVLTYKATVSSEDEVSLDNVAKAFAKQVEASAAGGQTEIALLSAVTVETPAGYEDGLKSNQDSAVVTAPKVEGGGDDTKQYTVTYQWNLPTDADATLPTGGAYEEGTSVKVDTNYANGTTITVNGDTYVFSGWDKTDFTMPAGNVTITGNWEKQTAPTLEYTVSYTWNGLPDEANEVVPTDGTFAEGILVKVDDVYTAGKIIAVGESENAKTYEFSGWSSEDVTIENGTFTMPGKDVILSGIWKEQAPNTPTFEDLQDLVKIIVTCGNKATHSEDFTEEYSLLENSYMTEENDDGSFTLTVNPDKYVAAFNEEHTGHVIDSEAIENNSFTVELSKTVQVSEPESPAPAPEVEDTEEPAEENPAAPVADADPVEQEPAESEENQTTEPEQQVTEPEDQTSEPNQQVTESDNQATESEEPKTEVSGATGSRAWVLKVSEKDTITFTVNCQKAPEITYTVTYTDGVNGQAFANQIFNDLTAGTNTPSFSGTPARQGYTFTGWSPAVSATVTGNATYVAQWRSTGGGGSGNGGGGGGGSTNIPDNPTPLDPGTQITDPDVPLAVAPGLNSTDHFAYIIGYPDGTVRPQGNITRAEVATIFFRLMTDEFRTTNWASTNSFPDVASASLWYNNAVSTAAKAGLLKGKEDGNFHPSQNITRAEFATIAARFLSDEEITAQPFPDTVGHWAEKDIIRAVQAGWIKGDSDGNFRPNDPITRAEAMTLVNRMLDRVPDKDHMLSDMVTWPDNPESAWFYEAVQEATNSHDYERDELGVTETWTSKLADRDWSALEKEWSDAASSTGSDVADNLQK